MKTIYIICCNDTVVCAAKTLDKADSLLDLHSREGFELNKAYYRSYKDYMNLVYWKVRSVDLYE